jgi:hypothetical protein
MLWTAWCHIHHRHNSNFRIAQRRWDVSVSCCTPTKTRKKTKNGRLALRGAPCKGQRRCDAYLTDGFHAVVRVRVGTKQRAEPTYNAAAVALALGVGRHNVSVIGSLARHEEPILGKGPAHLCQLVAVAVRQVVRALACLFQLFLRVKRANQCLFQTPSVNFRICTSNTNKTKKRDDESDIDARVTVKHGIFGKRPVGA